MSKKIKVVIRLRRGNDSNIWSVNNKVITKKSDNKETTYTGFDDIVYDIDNTVFYNLYIQGEIDKFLDEENCTIFAYGQTGSGKTYTMLGERTDGIIYMALKDVLDKKAIYLSFIEIYNEKIFDLYSNKELKMFNIENNTVITNLSSISTTTFISAKEFIARCEKNRKYGATEYNIKSSRSHTVFQIKYKRGSEMCTLNLIDLAGSERASKSDNRRAEGAFINKSLLALCTLIKNMQDGLYVGYRESKLTRLLQSSMNGVTNLTAICMLAPSLKCQDESVSTLNFAARLSNLEIKKLENKMPVQINQHYQNDCPHKVHHNNIVLSDLKENYTAKVPDNSLTSDNCHECLKQNMNYNNQAKATGVSRLYYQGQNSKSKELVSGGDKEKSKESKSGDKLKSANSNSLISDISNIKIFKLDMKQGCYIKEFKNVNLGSELKSMKIRDEELLSKHENKPAVDNKNSTEQRLEINSPVDKDPAKILIKETAINSDLTLNKNVNSQPTETDECMTNNELKDAEKTLISDVDSLGEPGKPEIDTTNDFDNLSSYDLDDYKFHSGADDQAVSDDETEDSETIILSDEKPASNDLNAPLKAQSKINFEGFSIKDRKYIEELVRTIDELEKINKERASEIEQIEKRNKEYKIEFERLNLKISDKESLENQTHKLLVERVESLEKMVSEMLKKNPSKRLNDIYILEKYMFNLKKEALSKHRHI